MPLLFQLSVHEDTSLGVWHIGEDEGFFRSHAVPQRAVGHPHKRLQHLAGRYLLRHLFPDFPTDLIRIADTRKPFLEDEAFHFSISHCSDYAAAIVSRTRRVGVDIEVITPKAARIRHKFATEGEWELVARSIADERWTMNHGAVPGLQNAVPESSTATLIWSCKEAIFKWYGAGEVDFKEHIQIRQACATGNGKMELAVVFQKGCPEALQVHAQQQHGLWLSYVAG